MALGSVAAVAVGTAVCMALRSVDLLDPETGGVTHYGWFETILTGFFCGAPVFLLGTWWAGRRLIPNA
jgi:hypothetical protein